LERYLAGESNRCAATARLFGCSERTAERILSRKTPFQGRLKLTWLHRLCAAIKKPIGRVIGDERAIGERLVGWLHGQTAQEQMQDAAELATAILFQAFKDYNLSGAASFNHEGGSPLKVEVSLGMFPFMEDKGGVYAPHRIWVTADREAGVMWLRYHHELFPRSFSGELTSQNLNLILEHIHALTKDICAKIVRESAGGKKNAQR
jgi:hypothetical protein